MHRIFGVRVATAQEAGALATVGALPKLLGTGP